MCVEYISIIFLYFVVFSTIALNFAFGLPSHFVCLKNLNVSRF